MSYGRIDGKDTLIFVESDSVKENVRQPETPIETPIASPESTQSEQSSEQSSEPEQSDEQMGAYNEATGEINWDCPCLGPMTKPPCGELFKEAFSCFVHSTDEPKGLGCVDQFRAMQDCFKSHPDIYGQEVDEPEDLEALDSLEVEGDIKG